MSDLLHGLGARFAPASARRLPWHHDPVRFVRDCVRFPEGEALTSYQEATLAAIPEHRRVALRSCRGAGKSVVAALSILWFALSRDLAGIDWKVPVTAGSWRQLERYLFVELRKWAGRIRWDQVGRPPFDRTELSSHLLKLTHGQVFGLASDDPSLLEGAHADSTFTVVDEGKSVSAATFDSLEGVLASVGESFVLVTSTPGEPVGRFYDICSRRPGLEDWHPVAVTLADAVAAGRVSEAWAAQRRRQWGESSAAYRCHVMGEFADSSEDSLIPLSWVEQAIERHRQWIDAGRPKSDEATVLGCDIARGGGDLSVVAVRRGPIIESTHKYDIDDVMGVVGRILTHMTEETTAVVDVVGLGSGVYDRLREQGHQCLPFNASARSTLKAGELYFQNQRSAGWWTLREALNAANSPELALPDDPELIGDLTSLRWSVTSAGRIAVEGKDSIRARLGRSPDLGDAVMMSLGPSARRRRRTMHAYSDRGTPRRRRPVASEATPYPNDPLIAKGA